MKKLTMLFGVLLCTAWLFAEEYAPPPANWGTPNYPTESVVSGRIMTGTSGSVFNANKTAGRVGIGTTSPSATLDVVGAVTVSSGITIKGLSINTLSAGTTSIIVYGAASQNADILRISTSATASTHQVRIDKDGNLIVAGGAAITGNSATATALAADPADAGSGYVCRGINASGTCQLAVVEDAATNSSTNAVTSNALYDTAALKASLAGSNAFIHASYAISVATSATSTASMCIIGAVTALPTSVINSGCFAWLTSDSKVYVSTMSPVTAAGDWKALW